MRTWIHSAKLGIKSKYTQQVKFRLTLFQIDHPGKAIRAQRNAACFAFLVNMSRFLSDLQVLFARCDERIICSFYISRTLKCLTKQDERSAKRRLSDNLKVAKLRKSTQNLPNHYLICQRRLQNPLECILFLPHYIQILIQDLL